MRGRYNPGCGLILPSGIVLTLSGLVLGADHSGGRLLFCGRSLAACLLLCYLYTVS